MKIKKVLLVVLVLVLLFSNCAIFADTVGNYYYKGTPTAGTSSGGQAGTYQANANDISGALTLIRIMIYVVIFVMVLLVLIFFRIRGGTTNKTVNKTEESDEVIQRRD